MAWPKRLIRAGFYAMLGCVGASARRMRRGTTMSDAEKLERAMFALDALTVLERRDDGAVVAGPVGWWIMEKVRAELAAAEPVRAEG